LRFKGGFEAIVPKWGINFGSNARDAYILHFLHEMLEPLESGDGVWRRIQESLRRIHESLRMASSTIWLLVYRIKTIKNGQN